MCLDLYLLYKVLVPLESSASIGCFNAVISRKVRRKSTTTSLSFLIGAICNKIHNGVSTNKLGVQKLVSKHLQHDQPAPYPISSQASQASGLL